MPRPRPTPPAASAPEISLEAAQHLLGALPEAAVLVRGKSEGGGFEILFANERFAALTGYAPADLAGQNTRLLHGPKTDLLAGRAGSGSPWRVDVGENWLHRKDGTAFYCSWEFRPLTTGILVGVYRDISEMRRFQEAMIHSQKLDTVGQLAGGVAHDFNNLLSIINGYCEILGGKLGPLPAAQKDLQEIHRAGLKAAGIARQILEFSRRQETEARAVNPNTLIREVADILRRVVGDAVKVELRLASDLGNTRIDPTQFQQVLLNLCFNARDAMPQGGKLTVRTFNQANGAATARLAAGNYVGIEVKDTGQGMGDETRARIFEPFFTTKPHGTGLGLAMAASVIRGAGGEIGVRSKPGAGTTFEILLPETAEPEQVFSTVLPALPSSRGTETLWLVESDEVLRKMVSGILAVDGYRVHEHASIASALTAAAAKSPAPDLVLLDGGANDAGKLVTALVGKNPRLKVLAVSVESPAAALGTMSPRALGHLPKPFALSTLLRAVRGLLDNAGR
jgi:two-component system cell cycle sensor histidine kinase/response regulator CckA